MCPSTERKLLRNILQHGLIIWRFPQKDLEETEFMKNGQKQKYHATRDDHTVIDCLKMNIQLQCMKNGLMEHHMVA